MNLKIKGKASGEIDVKRFYLPGITLESDCELCNDTKDLDLGGDYLSYPSFNCVQEIHFYCEDCNHEWDEEVILDLKIKKVKKND